MRHFLASETTETLCYPTGGRKITQRTQKCLINPVKLSRVKTPKIAGVRPQSTMPSLVCLSQCATTRNSHHAGRVGPKGFLPNQPKPSRYRDTLSSSIQSITPEEVLFKRQKAPLRYEESDFYFAHEHLSEEQRLPDADLLKAIHQYSSDFYANMYGTRASSDFRSMDGTALMAVGILLEEAMKESLGENGDKVFTEPEQYSVSLPEDPAVRAHIHGSVPVIDSPPYVSEESSEDLDMDHLAKKFKSDSRPRNDG